MRVVITAAAKADLIAIGDFIRSQNPERAITFVEELLDRCYALADMPRAYPLVPRYEKFGIRRTVHRDYLIFYRVHKELIEIIRILHGAQDYETLLFLSS
ncbi:type II toxin-antitoxin system RelE/ParE family toxin [Scytonema hofmannii FACHB-248]|uniref:Type II toxin-antitoxin system RelE/ParE family toxin n=1 Tax=Scytonema hofmannii FACHB-248 TaxID=1842502 RepID=A0ABR8GSE4_9CYAN|nr:MULTISPECIES: type II toxin-antitoxin system RelE/ParE family toxin [Nostocales]MBD2606258.1 type II toxin-antitoxin system RelE/ParE family toxin [Scytonema hofmannii FACHB-248]